MRLRPINIYRYEEIRDETSRVQNKLIYHPETYLIK